MPSGKPAFRLLHTHSSLLQRGSRSQVYIARLCSVLPFEISFSSHEPNNVLKGIFHPESRLLVFFFFPPIAGGSSETLVHHTTEKCQEYSFYPVDNEKPLEAVLKICVLDLCGDYVADRSEVQAQRSLTKAS